MNAYILTNGGHEDYRIVTVHSSMERALEHMYRRGDPADNYPEEHEFDPELPPVKEGFELGEVYCVRIWTRDNVIERKYRETKYRHPEKCEVKQYTLYNSETIIEVFSPISIEHAEKEIKNYIERCEFTTQIMNLMRSCFDTLNKGEK